MMETWMYLIGLALLIAVGLLLVHMICRSFKMRARPPGSFVDPVCGMAVESGKGYVKRHEGRELHFCSEICLAKFEANPERFSADQGES